MAAIGFSLLGSSGFYRADESSSSSVPPLSPSHILVNLSNSEPSQFVATPTKPLSRPLTAMEEKLAMSNLSNIANATHLINPALSNYCRMIVKKQNDRSPGLIASASLLYLHAQNNKLTPLAYFLYNQFGQSLITYYREYYHVLRSLHLGMSIADFDELVCKEIDYAQSSRLTATPSTESMFDTLFFERRSSEFLSFWNDLEAPYDDFRERFAAFPYHGVINYLPAQFELWKEFQKDPRTKHFPIQEIWRFGVDRNAEKLGPCALETEPGYMNAFLHGMLFALKSAHRVKNDEWYIRLHQETCSRSMFPSVDGLYDVSHTQRWNPLRSTFSQFTTKLRTNGVAWNYENLDRDAVGMDELRKRAYIKVDDVYKTIECKKNKPTSIAKNLENVMNHYQQQLNNAGDNHVRRLLVYLAHARQLSLDRYFDDVNARSSLLAFLSFIKADHDLPIPLFSDQNIFDANSPESVVYRYLEGCVNFMQGGRGAAYPKTDQIKRLIDLDLREYPELDALKSALKPLVMDKRWEQVVPKYIRKRYAKRVQREYKEKTRVVAKRVLHPS